MLPASPVWSFRTSGKTMPQRLMYHARPQRFPLRLRAKLTGGRRNRNEPAAGSIETWTENVSGHGLFVRFEGPVQPGTRIQISLELPIPWAEELVVVNCDCRVVRITRNETGQTGVGAEIEHYEFERQGRRSAKA